VATASLLIEIEVEHLPELKNLESLVVSNLTPELLLHHPAAMFVGTREIGVGLHGRRKLVRYLYERPTIKILDRRHVPYFETSVATIGVKENADLSILLQLVQGVLADDHWFSVYFAEARLRKLIGELADAGKFLVVIKVDSLFSHF